MDKRLKDFKNFLYLTWKHLNLPDPTPIQYDIADYLQSDNKRIIIEAFRGVGKSWITSAFVVHQLLLNPQRNILVVSASKTRSDDFSTFTQRLIHEMPVLEHLKPKESQRNSKIAFDVGPATASHAPSVKSVGITGQLTGSRADLIIADDVESLNNSQTQLMRDRLSETVKEFDAIIKPKIGRIVFLGTPQTEMSLYNDLDERGFTTRIWPARVPNKAQTIGYGYKLAPMITSRMENGILSDGEPVDPLRFNSQDLLEREASYGKSGFNLQFMLDTSLSDANKYPLKVNDLIVMSGLKSWSKAPAQVQWAGGLEQTKQLDSELPNVALKGDYYVAPMHVSDEWVDFEGSVMSVDPAGRGADKTAYAIVKMLHGTLYVVDVGGIDGGYSDEVLTTLANKAKTYGVNKVIIESNFGDGMATQLLKPVLAKIHPCEVEEVRHSIQKEKRMIDTLEPVMNTHRMVIDESIIREDFERMPDHQLFKQMTRLTREKGSLRHDDLLDALSIAVAYWVEVIDRDQQLSYNQHKSELLDRELERFIESATGNSDSSFDRFI